MRSSNSFETTYPLTPTSHSMLMPTLGLNGLQREKKIDKLMQALVKGHTKTYFEKIKLAFDSSTLLIPLLFANGLRRFIEIQTTLQSALNNNFYYEKALPPEVRTAISYDGATIGSEAPITTLLVATSMGFSCLATFYQALRYYHYKDETNKLIHFLQKHDYKDAESLACYALSYSQINEIRRLIIVEDEILDDTVIEAHPSWVEKFATDMQWFNSQSSKYTTPLLLISLIPGFFLIFRSAHALDGKIDCGMFPLWALFFDGCSVTEQYEVMSLLTYIWDCLSVTWFASRSLAITSRLALTPMPKLRQWFKDTIDSPFSQWWSNEDLWLYKNLIGKTLFASTMPLVTAYSLYSAGDFVNRYAQNTGCTDLAHIIKAFFAGNPDGIYPCSTTQISMAISGFLGDFEIGRLYAAFMAIETLSTLLALIVKHIPALNQDSAMQKAKALLKKINDINSKTLAAGFVGMLAGGLLGFLPAKRIANQILNEGFELFYHWDNNTIPLSPPFALPTDLDIAEIPVFDLVNKTLPCTISTILTFPETLLPQDISIPSFNLTMSCIEFINNATIGIQITPPCPAYTASSIFFLNLAGLPINCDPLLIIRAFAGFFAPFWLSASSGTVTAASITAAFLLSAWAIQALKRPQQQVLPSQTCASRANRNHYSPYFFANHERSPIALQTFQQDSSSMEDLSDEDLDINANPYSNPQPSRWDRIKNRISQFFHRPAAPVIGEASEQRSLLRGSRARI